MSGFNGSGQFLISGVGLPYVSGTVISSAVANTLNTQLATGLSTCILKDGTQTIEANIPWSNYKITGLGTGSASADAASVYNIQCNTGTFLTVTGADTIVGTATPALPNSSSYIAGMTFRFFAAGTNTGAVTLNISGLGAKAITKNGTSALIAGDIPSGLLVSVTYDGTQFVLNNQTTFGTLSVGSLTVTGTINVSGKAYLGGGNTLAGSNTLLGVLAVRSYINNGVTFVQNQAAVSTTLNGGITATDLTITLTDGTGFSTTGGTISIDNEQITYDSRAGNVLTVSSTANRGVNGTTAVSHNTGAAVSSTSFSTTVLTSSIDNLPTTTTIPVASTATFPNTGTLIIDGEQISYTGKTSTSFTGATRAVNGTTIASHLNGASVGGVQLITASSSLKYDDVTKSLTVPNITATNITATTASSGDNSTKVATTAFVQQNAGATSKIQPLTASVAGGAITATLGGTVLDFRNTASTGGSVSTIVSSSVSVTANGAATLGFSNAVQGRIAVLAILYSGSVELAMCNVSNGGINFDESGLITTTAISSGTSAGVVYSTTARTSVPYRVVGYIDATNTSTAWQSTYYAQGAGGNSIVHLTSLVAAPSQAATGAAIDFIVPKTAKRITITFHNVSRTDANTTLIQIGDNGPETTGYYSGSNYSFPEDPLVTDPYAKIRWASSTSGFVVQTDNAANLYNGTMVLTTVDGNSWVSTSIMQRADTYTIMCGAGRKTVSTGVNFVRIVRSTGTGTFDSGTIGLMYE